MNIIQSIGVICLTLSVLLEFISYYKQIAKTLCAKKSAQVSSSAFMYKLVKYIVTIIGLSIYANWAAVGIEVAALIACSMALYVICKAKPKKWRLFK